MSFSHSKTQQNNQNNDKSDMTDTEEMINNSQSFCRKKNLIEYSSDDLFFCHL